VIGPDGPHSVLVTLERMMFGFIHDFVQDDIKTLFGDRKRKPRSLNAMCKLIDTLLNVNGLVVEHVDVDDTTKTDAYAGFCLAYSRYRDDADTDFAILAGLRFLNNVDTGFFMLGNRWKVKILYHHVTPLGLSFANACGVRSR